MPETCAICGCRVHRDGEYAQPTVKGRSHATAHHFVAERFFGRSANRRATQRVAIFDKCPWDLEGQSTIYCYECHEEMIHNPVLSSDDVAALAELVKLRGLNEDAKSEDRSKLAERIQLLHEVISRGLREVLHEEHQKLD